MSCETTTLQKLKFSDKFVKFLFKFLHFLREERNVFLVQSCRERQNKHRRTKNGSIAAVWIRLLYRVHSIEDYFSRLVKHTIIFFIKCLSSEMGNSYPSTMGEKSDHS